MQDLQKVHVVYPISTDVIKPALHLRVAQGHPGTRTYVRTYIYKYIDRGHVEFDRRGSLTLAPITSFREEWGHLVASIP